MPRSQGQSPCSKCVEKYHPRRQIFDQSKDSKYECECEVPVVQSEEKYLLRHWNDIGNNLSVFGLFAEKSASAFKGPGSTDKLENWNGSKELC